MGETSLTVQVERERDYLATHLRNLIDEVRGKRWSGGRVRQALDDADAALDVIKQHDVPLQINDEAVADRLGAVGLVGVLTELEEAVRRRCHCYGKGESSRLCDDAVHESQAILHLIKVLEQPEAARAAGRAGRQHERSGSRWLDTSAGSCGRTKGGLRGVASAGGEESYDD